MGASEGSPGPDVQEGWLLTADAASGLGALFLPVAAALGGLRLFRHCTGWLVPSGSQIQVEAASLLMAQPWEAQSPSHCVLLVISESQDQPRVKGTTCM